LTKGFHFSQALAGMTLGAACSCKNTAWGLIALNGVILVVEFLFDFEEMTCELVWDFFQRGVEIGVGCLGVYFMSFIVHFLLLPFQGGGMYYLSPDMHRQLLNRGDRGHMAWGLRLTGGSLIWRALRLTWIMHSGNMGITAWHPCQSRPVGWPLLNDIRVNFWGDSDQHEIACMGNVFSYYFALLGIVTIPFGFCHPRWIGAMRFTIGWAVSYFPFYLVPRTMYLYHYLIPLIIGAMACGASLELHLPPFARGVAAIAIAFLAAVGFVLWKSFCYGTKAWDKHIIIWNQNWIHGDRVHRELAKR
jgi:dolichyl-phosphate-mannose--protein O-mannosyl transferase